MNAEDVITMMAAQYDLPPLEPDCEMTIETKSYPEDGIVAVSEVLLEAHETDVGLVWVQVGAPE